MSKWPPAYPAPLSRQHAMASARVAEQVRPEDSASHVSSSTGPWNFVQGQGVRHSSVPGQTAAASSGEDPWGQHEPPAPIPMPASVPEAPKSHNEDDSDELPEVPPDMRVPASVPVRQAAQNLVNAAQRQQEKLDKQKERARKHGKRSMRWGQMSGSNAQNFQLPHFAKQIGAGQDERSVLLIDDRDQRLLSPFQGWVLDEILVNAHAGISVLSDKQLVRSPSSGYHMSLFYLRTVNGYKLVMVGSMTCYGHVPCAGWNESTGNVMSHPAFQPFRWPLMTEESSTWVDVKIKVEGEMLVHLELRGYRSDKDLSVQMNYLDDRALLGLPENLFVPSCIVTIFKGWRVVATSFEVGGRMYACADGGAVVALDFPLCHFEVRLTASSSVDAFGTDADRLEFRFLAAHDGIDVACSQMMVPSTWLVVSRVTGRTMVDNAKWCRKNYARVEGPDQNMQLSQLAGVHAHWTAEIEARSVEDTGPRIGAVEVGSHEANVHLTCESPLFKCPRHLVPASSLALQNHEAQDEQLTAVLPPVTGGR